MTLVYKMILSDPKEADNKIRPFILIDSDEDNYIFYKVQSGSTIFLEQNKHLYLMLSKDLCFSKRSAIAVNEIKFVSRKINFDKERYIYKCKNKQCLKCKECKFKNKKIKQVAIKDKYSEYLKNKVKDMRNNLHKKLIDDQTFNNESFNNLNKKK